MPNTLAHLGAQALGTRLVLRAADPRWILAGSVLPDVAWIAQRAVRILVPGTDLYALRLYGIVQASLLCCLLLAGAVSLVSRTPRRAFATLALGSVLHLGLDALQTKWANGVHLLAPLSWELWNARLFWPESLPTLILILWGLAYGATALWALARRPAEPLFGPVGWRRALAAAALLAAYAAVPLALTGPVLEADNHYVATLTAPDRTGRAIELDRAAYRPGPGGPSIRNFADETIALAAPLADHPATISLRGRFTDHSTIAVEAYHVHEPPVRDFVTYAGLALVAASWIVPAVRRQRHAHTPSA